MIADRREVTPGSVYDGEWTATLATVPSVRPQDCLGVARADAVLVVGAHPDDETFGFGASIASLSNAGIAVHALTMSSGEAALDHLGRTVDGLGLRRAEEFDRACRVLGMVSSTVLHLPDSRLSRHDDALRSAVAEMVQRVEPVHVLTVWWGDPHPDHRAVGQAAVAAACDAGCPVSGFPIWAQHWSGPMSETGGSQHMQPMANDAHARRSRRRAVGCYRSQTEPLSADLHPILPPSLVRWTTELLVHATTRRSAIPVQP